nr:trypsin-like peptidase domain-containing protein [Synergistaceae bacterium]
MRKKFLASLIILVLSAGAAFALSAPNASNPVVQIVKNASPAVVNIDVEKKAAQRVSPFPFDDDPFFKHFFGDAFKDFTRSVPMKGRGSGFIVTKDGQILTNNHVVDGVDIINVTLSDGKVYPAKVLGKDPTYDLAVIKIEVKDKDLPILELGDSDLIEVGEGVVAIGNPYGLEQTVTTGVISAKNRSVHAQDVNFDGFLQTDAAINPGNSGGPLLNLDGKVKRGWLGVSIQNVTPEMAKLNNLKDLEGGVILGDVFKDSAAEKGGLKRGDIITHVNNEKVKDVNWFVQKIRTLAPNSETALKVIRRGKSLNIKIKLDERPDSADGRSSNNNLNNDDKGEANKLLEKFGIDDVRELTANLRRQFKLKDNASGIMIANVTPNSPAALAGLRAGDLLIEVNNHEIKNLSDLKSAVKSDDDVAILLIERDSSTFFVQIKTSK